MFSIEIKNGFEAGRSVPKSNGTPKNAFLFTQDPFLSHKNAFDKIQNVFFVGKNLSTF
jgi:hypothetical protein